MQISLKAARVNANLSQVEAAAALAVNTATIGRWEAGKSYPKATQLAALCRLYGVQINDIFLIDKSN